MDPGKLLGILLLLLVFLKKVNGGQSKKTIKIHVPYYVKHIHHYKKVYVPKVQVVKHEHLHKKEHEHHHHHDHHHGHGHHGYDKSSDGGYIGDSYESYYDEIDHRSYNKRLPKSRQRIGQTETNDNYQGRSSEEVSSEEEDYDSDGEGTVPAPLQYRTRQTAPTNRKPLRPRTWAERKDVIDSVDVPTAITKLPVKRVIARITTE